MPRIGNEKAARIACLFNFYVFQDLFAITNDLARQIFILIMASYFLPCLIWAAILSRSLRPCEVSFLPPLASFSTSFSCSKVWSPFLAILPEPRLQWLGQLPLLRRTRIVKISLNIFQFVMQKIFELGNPGIVCGVKWRNLQESKIRLEIHLEYFLNLAFLFTPTTRKPKVG